MPWEFVGKWTNYTKVCAIHRLYTTLHTKILGFADILYHIGSMEKFFDFFKNDKTKKPIMPSFVL